MLLKYKGRKESLNLTRPELEKNYTFKGSNPVEVTENDGALLLKSYPRSFDMVEAEEKVEKGKGKDKDKGK